MPIPNNNSQRQFSKNGNRSSRLLSLWKEDKTIREASLLAGVPEGTVSYYWRKFNRTAAKGRMTRLSGEIDDKSRSEEKQSKTEEVDPTFALLKTRFVTEVSTANREQLELIELRLNVFEKMKRMGLMPTYDEMMSGLETILKASLIKKCTRT